MPISGAPGHFQADPAFDAPEPADDFPVLNADVISQADTDVDLHEFDTLLALYDKAETEAAEAAERFEAIKKETKRILFELRPDPDDRKVEVRSKHLHAPLRMIYVAGRKSIDRKALDRDHPGLAARYEKTGQPSWTLRRVKDTGE